MVWLASQLRATDSLTPLLLCSLCRNYWPESCAFIYTGATGATGPLDAQRWVRRPHVTQAALHTSVP